MSNTDNSLRDYLQDYVRVEHYLLSLTNKHFVLDNVYERIMGLFQYTCENYHKVLFSYLDRHDELISTIYKEDGKMHEYAVIENGKIYHVWKNGDWKYRSDNITISYSKKEDGYVSHVKGRNLPAVTNEDPAIALERIQSKINKLIAFAFY